jgi:octopine/nopaline transport system permease protein
MSRLLLLRRIILPKTARLVLPAYSNEVIQMMLSTSLASLVTIYDLMGVTKQIYNRTYAVYTLYPTAGFMYLLMMLALTWIFRSIEFRLSGHLRERPSAEGVKGEPLPALTPTLR